MKDQCLPSPAVLEMKSLLSNDLYSSKQIPLLKLMTSLNSWANTMCSGDLYRLQGFSVKELDALSLQMCHLCPVGNVALLQLYPGTCNFCVSSVAKLIRLQ